MAQLPVWICLTLTLAGCGAASPQDSDRASGDLSWNAEEDGEGGAEGPAELSPDAGSQRDAESPRADAAQQQATGACDNAADRSVLASVDQDALVCEGAVCVARNLTLALPPSIARDGTEQCVAEQAPSLERLSAGCRACFVEISLCVPSRCVALLGGESDACSRDGLPSTEFASCAEPALPSEPCASCQAPCGAAFRACSGLSDGREP